MKKIVICIPIYSVFTCTQYYIYKYVNIIIFYSPEAKLRKVEIKELTTAYLFSPIIIRIDHLSSI